VDVNGELLAVTWAPMFEGVQMCAAKDMALYHSAHAEFVRLIEEGQFAESHTVRERLEPGQCLVFNNRRMLHGRKVSGFWRPKRRGGREAWVGVSGFRQPPAEFCLRVGGDHALAWLKQHPPVLSYCVSADNCCQSNADD